MLFKQELFMGTSTKTFNSIISLLDSKKIKYYIKVVDQTSSEQTLFGKPTRRSTGTLFMNTDYLKQYYIFVKNKDFSIAKSITKDISD